MPKFAIISLERHRGKKWLRPKSFGFAASDALAPIDGSEVAQAARAMPLAFAEQGGGRYALVAMLSLIAGRNLFVASDGKWLGSYIPATLRAYPFRLLPKEDGNAALVIDEESGLVADGSAAGEDFFDERESPSPALTPVIELLTLRERYRKITDQAVAALAEAGIIAPWPITLKSIEGERALGGLYRIDEAALAALPDESFLKLRAANSLSIAYAQLLSEGQIDVLARLARAQARPSLPSASTVPSSLDRFFGLAQDEGLLQFD